MAHKNHTFKEFIIILVIVILISGFTSALISVYFYNYYLIPRVKNSNLIEPIIKIPVAQEEISQKVEEPKIVLDEEKIIKAVEKVSPSVVSIVVSKYVSQYYGDSQKLSPEEFFKEFEFNWPFSFEFSWPVPQQKEIPKKEVRPKSDPGSDSRSEKEKQEVGGGTGFVISQKDGLILTNKHVVIDEEAEYTVITNDAKKYEAKVLARDPFNDVAILQVLGVNLPEVDLGDSDKISIGQTVLAIGNALGEYRNTVTKGVISGIGRHVIAGGGGQETVLENVIQTDAAINFGNSGGPLINLNGEVIGINTAISLQGQLIGFALPINQAKRAIQGVKKSGKITYPFLGVRYVVINQEIAKKNNLSVDSGVLIVKGNNPSELAITPNSPADRVGLKENDIILEIDGKKITEENSLGQEIRNHQPGDKVKLKVLSGGKEKIITVTLEEYQK